MSDSGTSATPDPQPHQPPEEDEEEQVDPSYCRRCRDIGETNRPFHKTANSKACHFYRPRGKKAKKEEEEEVPWVPTGPDLFTPLPLDIKDALAGYLDVKSLGRLSRVNKTWSTALDNEAAWARQCRKRNLKMPVFRHPDEVGPSFKKLLVSETFGRCYVCLQKTANRSVFLSNLHVCWACAQKHQCLTQTRAKKEYKLNDKDLEGLPHLAKGNPHYRNAAPMILYLVRDVEDVAYAKHGGPEGLAEAQEKGKKRSEAVRAGIERRRQERQAELEAARRPRREAMEAALRARNIEWRDDSKLCEQYVAGTSSYTLNQIADIMVDMHILHSHTPYVRIVDQKCDEAREERDREREDMKYLGYRDDFDYPWVDFDEIREDTKSQVLYLYKKVLADHPAEAAAFEKCAGGRPIVPDSYFDGKV
ncbi:hypothetical protein DFS34DRAFT_644636 [Phlyctochytrium arcticum]|nr:hypothetical protein DFS34DRAFT_644636 [Phlyctochytrium arcticum]